MAGVFKKFGSIGPAAFVAAAFIGPGTVTTCTLAGSGFGYALLWALLFSVAATLILQEMSARLGLVGKMGLGEALRAEMKSPAGRALTILLVLTAVAIGNAAYETGNIMGGAMGLGSITGITEIGLFGLSIPIWGPVVGLAAFALLFSGSYKIIEKGLIALVIIMSITFLTTAFMVKPDIMEIARGAFVPSIPGSSTLTIVGLIGTTVVPYNLFLHASTVKQRWSGSEHLQTVRTDSIISIGAGGLISMAIVVTSASAFFGTGIAITGAADMAGQLGPLLGNASSYFLAAGLLAAGISSAITAPLAAAYATSEILGWKEGMKGKRFRAVWIAVLLTGTIFSATGFKPVSAIFIAQVTNGILLPFIAIFLLKVMNSSNILGKWKNGPLANIMGGFVLVVAIVLGVKSIVTVFGMI